MLYSQSNFKQSATNNKITKQCTKYSKSLLAIAVSTAFFQPVLAENNTAKNLDTIEITGSTSGISDNIITAEQLQNYQANDLEDVFILDPSVTVGGSIGVAQKVYVRGLEDTLVNITIDSAPQSGQLFHHNGRISLEPELIKQIEVSAGAGEATNGAGALGGAIRFVTKDPEDLLRDGEQFGALIKSNYFSNTDAYKASATLFGRLNEDLSAMISYITSEGDNFEDGDSNELEGTESDSEIGFAKIVAHITDSQTFRISYDNIKDEGDRAQRPQWVVSDWNKLYPMETERKTTTASYELNPDENEVLNFKFTGYQSEQDLFQDGRFGPYKGSIETLGFDLRNTSLFDQHEVIYGTDYRKDKNYLGPGNDPKLDKEDINISGIYVQDHFQITNKFMLSTGLRYDKYELTDNTKQKISDEKFSPNIGFVYNAGNGLEFNGGYAEAMRGKDLIGTFKLDSRTNDPDIKAEAAHNIELGFDYEQDSFRLKAQVYRTRIENAISDQARVFQNIGTLRSQGFITEIGYNWDVFSTGLSLHRNNAKLDGQTLNAYDHSGLGNSTGDTLTTNFTYDLNSDVQLGWSGRFVNAVRDIETTAGKINKPGYGVHDFYVAWLPTSDEDLELTITTKNAFDKKYVDHASNGSFEHISGWEGVVGLPEAGRDVRVGIKWRI